MVSLNTDNTLHNILNIREDEVRCWAIIAAMLKPSSVLYDEWCATLYIMQQNECCIFCVWEISMCFEWVRFCQLYLWFYEKLFRYRDSIPHDAQIHECLKGQHSICSVLTSLSLSFFLSITQEKKIVSVDCPYVFFYSCFGVVQTWPSSNIMSAKLIRPLSTGRPSASREFAVSLSYERRLGGPNLLPPAWIIIYLIFLQLQKRRTQLHFVIYVFHKGSERSKKRFVEFY